MLREFFANEAIEYFYELDVKDLVFRDPGKLLRIEEKCGRIRSGVIFLLPYFAGKKATNLSVYAMPRDYHYYLRLLSDRFRAYLDGKGIFSPFWGGADSTPLDERDAALKAGLGVMGKNGLILNETYGSFCFIGEFLLTEPVSPGKAKEKKECPACGACEKACPTGAVKDPKREKCLSYLSQKKNRTPEEEALVKSADCKWGCDICQEVCPFNRKAAFTPIPFFREELVERLTPEAIEEEKEAFSKRAYAWRGRELLRKNLKDD